MYYIDNGNDSLYKYIVKNTPITDNVKFYYDNLHIKTDHNIKKFIYDYNNKKYLDGRYLAAKVFYNVVYKTTANLEHLLEKILINFIIEYHC